MVGTLGVFHLSSLCLLVESGCPFNIIIQVQEDAQLVVHGPVAVGEVPGVLLAVALSLVHLGQRREHLVEGLPSLLVCLGLLGCSRLLLFEFMLEVIDGLGSLNGVLLALLNLLFGLGSFLFLVLGLVLGILPGCPRPSEDLVLEPVEESLIDQPITNPICLTL